MPIEVRHDVPIAASAGLAALAGTAQAQIKERDEQRARGRIAMQLGAQAERQHMQIQAAVQGQQRQIEAASAQAHQQAEYAKDQLGLRAGLQEEMQDQKFSQEIERMELEAQTQAEQYEWKLDVTAKKRQNQHRKELAWLQSPEALEHYELNEIRHLIGETTRSLLNPQKTPYEREPQWDDSIPDEFKGGMPGTLPDGTYGYFTPNRTTNVAEFHQLDPSKTMAGIEAKQEAEEAKVRSKELDARQERIEDIREFRYNLSHTKDEDTGKFPGGFEIDRRTLERFGGQAIEEFRGQDLGRTTAAPPAEISTEELEQELQQRIDTVKQAKAFLKKMEKKYKNVENIPPEILSEIMRADEIVRQVGRR